MDTMNFLESLTLPADHPLRLKERREAARWRVDYTAECTLGILGVSTVVEVGQCLEDLDTKINIAA